MLVLTICLTLTTQNVIGQANGDVSSITLNDTTADQIVRSLERIIEQNDGSSLNSLFSSYIGMMAFLVGIALVIFGFQLSRAEKVTPTARRAYRILILALLVPVVVIFIYAISPFSRAGEMHTQYLGVASLLMIPTVAVLALMASGFHRKL
jgi:Ca2+/Na+ antiporter